MTYELNNSELDLVSGGDLKEVHFNPGYKEPTVLLDDGINIRTSGLFHSNVGYEHPLLPFRLERAAVTVFGQTGD